MHAKIGFIGGGRINGIELVFREKLGARFMSRRVKSLTLTRLFASALVLLAVQRIYLLLAHG